MNSIIVDLLQPRLDANVSKDMKHLLKSPFCIHQGTQKLCCPLNETDIDNFDPDKDVPSIEQLLSAAKYPEEHRETIQQFNRCQDTMKNVIRQQRKSRNGST